MFTDDKDVEYKILLQLSDKDLVNFCQTDKFASEICEKDEFWKQRVFTKYIPIMSREIDRFRPGLNSSVVAIEILNQYKGERTWANYYIYDLRKITLEPGNMNLYIKNKRLDHVLIASGNGAYTYFNHALITKLLEQWY